jgi:CRP-like cAMP-binding protein
VRPPILDVDLPALLAVGERVVLRKGEWIEVEADAHPFLYVVLSGGLQLSAASSTGREIVLQNAGPGSVVGVDVLNPVPEARARILLVTGDDTAVCRLSLGAFRRFLRSHPDAALALLYDTCAQLSAAFDLIRDLALYDVETRLAHLLARLAATDPDGKVWATHTELAAMIGTSQTRVTRLLAELRARGLIDYRHHGRGITILDAEELRSDRPGAG